jgi:hypothetical protein
MWRSGDHALALDAVQAGPSTPSLRGAKATKQSIFSVQLWIAPGGSNDGIKSLHHELPVQ